MAPPPYKLYTFPGSLFAFAPLVVSEYAGVAVEIINNDIAHLKQLSPTGKAPVLETPKGEVLFSSLAIARFLANLRKDIDLLGKNSNDSYSSLRNAVAIEDWTNWAAQDLELPVCLSYYMVTKCMKFDQTKFAKAKNDMSSALGILEAHLGKGGGGGTNDNARTYLVLDEQVTLADIVVLCYLVYPFTLIFEEAELEDNFPNVRRWFSNCMQQEEFVSVLGKIHCGKTKGGQS